MNTRKKLVLIVGLLALLTMAVTALVLAQEPDTPRPDESLPGSLFGHFRGRGIPGFAGLFGRGEITSAIAGALGLSSQELAAARADGQNLEDLAVEQGVTLADIEAAVKAAWTEAVTGAQAAGELTAAQAEFLLERGVPRLRWGAPGRGIPAAGLIDKEASQAAVAGLLGLSVAELKAARAEGTTLRELMTEAGVTPAEVRAALAKVRTVAIEQALADGLITEAQAERLLSGERAFGPGGRRYGWFGSERFGTRGLGPGVFGSGNGAPATAPLDTQNG